MRDALGAPDKAGAEMAVEGTERRHRLEASSWILMLAHIRRRSEIGIMRKNRCR